MKSTLASTILQTLCLLAGAVTLMATAPNGCQPPGTSCEERVSASNEYVYGVLEANLACTVNEECTTANVGTQCQGSCPMAVSVSGAAAVAEAVDYANQTWCATYMEDGCPYATPSCLYGVPVCQEGQCVLSYEYPMKR